VLTSLGPRYKRIYKEGAAETIVNPLPPAGSAAG